MLDEEVRVISVGHFHLEVVVTAVGAVRTAKERPLGLGLHAPTMGVTPAVSKALGGEAASRLDRRACGRQTIWGACPSTHPLGERITYLCGARSTTSIGDHPVHPMMIPFPIASFVATLVCDLAFWRTGNSDWFTGSEWLLGAGIVMALLAAIAGLIDVLGELRIHALGAVWWHAGGNLLLVLIQIWNWYLRHSEGAGAVLPTGLTCRWWRYS